MMNAKYWMITTVMILGILLMGACSALVPETGSGQVDSAATQNALIEQAVQATATTGALQTQVSQLQTQVAVTPTEAPQQATATPTEVPPTATPTLVPTATAVPPTPTPSVPCNSVAFVRDVTIPDGSVLTPGMSFTKTWRLRNAGSCTWTPLYDLVFVSGDSMGAPAVVDMPGYVAPGEVIDLSVDMTAPAHDGYFRGYWRLRDAQGVLFGIGSNGASFYVDIRVQAPRTDGPLDFVASYCAAEWTSGAGRLPCQGQADDSRGFVRRIDRPTLESGYVDDEPALLTHPQMITDGVIRGKYPAMRVEKGMYFVAVIGCAYQAERCDVHFQLDYQIGNGSIQTLATWHEAYEGQFRPVEVDLSGLNGKDVRFILTVLSNGSSSDDRALWLAPRIISKGIPNIIDDPRGRRE